ncbi:MAG TPA: deoxyribodipyrimidine photo-lyase, partial [Candidatus Binatia bacterium]|nr:deoxyribodipyrimidine photo-lyase [Candidatus Binatia bacterium]
EALCDHPRVTLRKRGVFDAEGQCVVYWMQRSQRAVDNPALNLAIEAANLLKKPAVVFFSLIPNAHHANRRHYQFMLEGLPDVALALRERRVGFVWRRFPDHGLLQFCSEVRPCMVVSDENPMAGAERLRTRMARQMQVPFWTVDADVIIPARLLAKEHYAARTIRPKIHALLPEFLGPVGNPKARMPWKTSSKPDALIPDPSLIETLPVDRATAPLFAQKGGTQEALTMLRQFIEHKLKGYSRNRNRPDLDGTSRLSSYLHFGQIGPHTVALAVQKSGAPLKDRSAFLEELIVRRELAYNFVRFNPRYETFQSAEPWAKRTLNLHAKDKREHLYTEAQLENAETHDPLWNAAQKQMVLTGWMHGYLRMYWAKKILEWSSSAAAAYDIAVRLNDRYELDGRDPNGYAGIAWAIVGKHDRAWGPERSVYGKIRYMSYASTSRKFDRAAYIAQIEALQR